MSQPMQTQPTAPEAAQPLQQGPQPPQAEAKLEPHQRAPAKMHAFTVHNTNFIIDATYSPLKPIGSGAYGVVCSAFDKLTERKVAIKKITRAFDDLVDSKRIVREIKLLRHFQHDNVVGLVDMIHPAPGYDFEDIYMVLEFMETDLHKIIYSKNALTDEHIQYFVYQTLKALKYIHSANVIHRDLKPSNLLLNSNCDLKVCDFGLARGVNNDDNYELTEYVVTRWYRAPEVMCSCQEYDHKIDVWSLGCIMAELLLRKPLFPGDDYIHQMNLIFNVLGTPSEEDMEFISNARALQYIRSIKKRPMMAFDRLFPNASPLCIDLMQRMLAFDPRRRISVDEALAHPYLRSLHNPKLETTCKTPFDFDFERIRMNKPALQAFTLEEIIHFRPYVAFQRQFAPHVDNLRILRQQLGQTANTHQTNITPLVIPVGSVPVGHHSHAQPSDTAMSSSPPDQSAAAYQQQLAQAQAQAHAQAQYQAQQAAARAQSGGHVSSTGGPYAAEYQPMHQMAHSFESSGAAYPVDPFARPAPAMPQGYVPLLQQQGAANKMGAQPNWNQAQPMNDNRY